MAGAVRVVGDAGHAAVAKRPLIKQVPVPPIVKYFYVSRYVCVYLLLS